MSTITTEPTTTAADTEATEQKPDQCAVEQPVTTGASGTLSEDEAREVAGSLMLVSPTDLVIEDNIRTVEKAPEWLVASVKEHGVIVPVLAHPDASGRIIIRDGQLRTLAARAAQTPAVPAYVVQASDERRIRIIQQFVANEHRAAFNDAERAEAWRQLTLEGMTVTAIAKTLGAKRAVVKAGVAVAERQVAKDAVASYDLTLDQALVLAGFEDEPDTLAELRKVAKERPGSFDHAAQRAADERERREQIATARTEAEAKGWTVVDLPDYGDSKTLRLSELETTTGERLTEANYSGKPGHAVALGSSGGGVKIIHLVVDYKAHGLRKIGSKTTTGAWTDEQKAERRTVIANNKAWDSAQKVRRTWLTTFLSRKRLPADAPVYAALVLAGSSGALSKAVDNKHPLACELLGITEQHRYGKPHPLTLLVENTPAKAGHVTLALALGAIEASTGKHTWRSPGKEDARYLSQLAAWGYVLSDVEQIVVDAHKPAAAKAKTTPADTGEPKATGVEVKVNQNATPATPKTASTAAAKPTSKPGDTKPRTRRQPTRPATKATPAKKPTIAKTATKATPTTGAASTTKKAA